MFMYELWFGDKTGLILECSRIFLLVANHTPQGAPEIWSMKGALSVTTECQLHNHGMDFCQWFYEYKY